MRVATVTRLNDGSYQCRYAYGGKSYICFQFDVLTGNSNEFKWTFGSEDHVAYCSLHIGGSKNHYIGRHLYKKGWDIGTIDTANKALFYSYFSGSKKRFIENYETGYESLCLTSEI